MVFRLNWASRFESGDKITPGRLALDDGTPPPPARLRHTPSHLHLPVKSKSCRSLYHKSVQGCPIHRPAFYLRFKYSKPQCDKHNHQPPLLSLSNQPTFHIHTHTHTRKVFYKSQRGTTPIQPNMVTHYHGHARRRMPIYSSSKKQLTPYHLHSPPNHKMCQFLFQMESTPKMWTHSLLRNPLHEIQPPKLPR